MNTKIRVDLEYQSSSIRDAYTVRRCVNTLDPKPGDHLTESETADLIRRVTLTGGSVNIAKGKKR